MLAFDHGERQNASMTQKVLAMPNRSCIMASMNRLTSEQRARILHLLCEGSSIRAITRLTGASKNTMVRLLS